MGDVAGGGAEGVGGRVPGAGGGAAGGAVAEGRDPRVGGRVRGGTPAVRPVPHVPAPEPQDAQARGARRLRAPRRRAAAGAADGGGGGDGRHPTIVPAADGRTGGRARLG